MHLRPFATLLLGLALLGAWEPAHAQRRAPPDVCPWCRGEPELMAKAEVSSHGPFPLAQRTTAELQKLAGETPWIFLETPHMRWAFGLGPSRVDQRDRPRVEAELALLRARLPEVPAKVRQLDPHLRLHLLAMRAEAVYTRFQEILQVRDADFPAERMPEGPYMGNGPFLGEKERFEVVVHPSRAIHHRFTDGFTGARATDSLRWHFSPEHKLLVSVPAEDSDLRVDEWLFPHIAHNLAHLYFCAYKHFSFDPPVWLDEGLALMIEKEVEPRSTTFEGEEGTKRDDKGPSSFQEAALKLAGSAKAPTLARLLQVKEFGQLDVDDRVVCWAIVRAFHERRPAEFARFLGGIKGQLDEQGYPSGANLVDLQRRLLKELCDWSPADLDALWREHVRAQPKR